MLQTKEAPISVKDSSYEIYADNEVVWLQANRHFGSFHPDYSSDLENIGKARDLLGRYTLAGTVARMSPGALDFIDIDAIPIQAVYKTEGVITANPDVLLNANPSDCGEIAVYGQRESDGETVRALLHSSKKTVADKAYISALDYMAGYNQISPDNMQVIMSASARAESYMFPDIDEHQKIADIWQDYVYQDDEGNWHVDLHTKTIDDLVRFGIPKESFTIHQADTIADTNFYSHYRSNRLGEKRLGTNGILFARRS